MAKSAFDFQKQILTPQNSTPFPPRPKQHVYMSLRNDEDLLYVSSMIMLEELCFMLHSSADRECDRYEIVM